MLHVCNSHQGASIFWSHAFSSSSSVQTTGKTIQIEDEVTQRIRTSSWSRAHGCPTNNCCGTPPPLKRKMCNPSAFDAWNPNKHVSKNKWVWFSATYSIANLATEFCWAEQPSHMRGWTYDSTRITAFYNTTVVNQVCSCHAYNTYLKKKCNTYIGIIWFYNSPFCTHNHSIPTSWKSHQIIHQPKISWLFDTRHTHTYIYIYIISWNVNIYIYIFQDTLRYVIGFFLITTKQPWPPRHPWLSEFLPGQVSRWSNDGDEEGR